MQPRSALYSRLLLPLVLLPLAACSATGPKDAQVRAQRPFISSETTTVGDQVISVEAGGAVVSGRETEIPIALRYGLGPRSELFVQTSPYRSVDRNNSAPDGSGWGDSFVGVRHRLRDADMFSPAYGFQLSTKLPSGRPGNGLGSGEIDWFGALMAQQTYYGFETTGFYQLGLLGEQFEPDINLEHTFAVQSRKPMNGPITAFGEFAFIAEPEIDRTETTLMGGMSIQLDQLTSVDIAIRLGLGDDAEDFQVLFGISRALGMLFFPDQETAGSVRN